MFLEVVEYVGERIAYLPRRPEHARVVTITPHAPGATERAIDGLRHADGESLDTAPEPRRLVRFYQQMQMVILHAEMKNAEAMSAGRPECCPYRAEGTVASQRG